MHVSVSADSVTGADPWIPEIVHDRSPTTSSFSVGLRHIV